MHTHTLLGDKLVCRIDVAVTVNLQAGAEAEAKTNDRDRTPKYRPPRRSNKTPDGNDTDGKRDQQGELSACAHRRRLSGEHELNEEKH